MTKTSARSLWGTTSSSVQSLGAAPASDWFRWEELKRAPRSGAGNGAGDAFPDDVALLASLGLTTHQLTIDWARIEPEPGRLDHDAVEQQRIVLDVARSAGLEVWACLFDRSLPGWFSEDRDGIVDDRSRGYFWARHVDRCAELFGDLVTGWVPVRSPYAYAASGFLAAETPPGKSSPEQFGLALRGAHLAGIDAWRRLSGGGWPVMSSMDLAVVEPTMVGREPREQVAAENVHRTIDTAMWSSWIGLIEEGVLIIPGRADEEIPHARGAYDLIGFSYQGGRGAHAEGNTTPYPQDAPVDAVGRSVWSEGLGNVLRRLDDALPARPLVVTSCEVATRIDPARAAVDDDGLRTEHLSRCLDEADRAIADGLDLQGFLAGTAIDGYEWLQGFGAATGIIDRDRGVKTSGQLLAERGRPSPPKAVRPDEATE